MPEANLNLDDFEHTDDELVAETGPKNVVVFSEIATKKATSADPISKAQMKAFMVRTRPLPSTNLC